MTNGDEQPDIETIVAETIEFVRVAPAGDGWVGRTPPWFGDRIFGGFVLGQAVHAATRTAPDHGRIHSLHAYFLSPMLAGPPVDYDVQPLRDGRSFSSRLLHATQEGRPVFTMTCSFTADGEGYEYGGLLDPHVPGPDASNPELDDGPWEIGNLGPTEPGADGVHDSTHRIWIRAGAPLPDDPHLHDALLAFMTDVTFTSTRPLRLEGDTRGIVSLDHTIHFHRQARADDWLFYDCHSVVNTMGRGVLRGSMYTTDRRIAASVTQETLLLPYEQFE